MVSKISSSMVAHLLSTHSLIFLVSQKQVRKLNRVKEIWIGSNNCSKKWQNNLLLTYSKTILNHLSSSNQLHLLHLQG